MVELNLFFVFLGLGENLVFLFNVNFTIFNVIFLLIFIFALLK